MRLSYLERLLLKSATPTGETNYVGIPEGLAADMLVARGLAHRVSEDPNSTGRKGRLRITTAGSKALVESD